MNDTEFVYALGQDCATLAILGYEDLTDPQHPLADELRSLPIEDLERVGFFVHGALLGASPAPSGHTPPPPPAIPIAIDGQSGGWSWTLFLLVLLGPLLALGGIVTLQILLRP